MVAAEGKEAGWAGLGGQGDGIRLGTNGVGQTWHGKQVEGWLLVSRLVQGEADETPLKKHSSSKWG